MGPIKIMFPLVTTHSEFRQARWLLNEVMEDLAEERIPSDAGIEVGMMVEVPSAALMADQFAREVDFFSIGTNDLIQYTLAADRTNEAVASLYSPGDPAVLRLIDGVVKAAQKHQVGLTICGGVRGGPLFTML